MKFSIRIFSFVFALILSCYVVLCPVQVKASSLNFNTDYSSVLDITQIQGIIGGLSSSALSALYNSLGGLAYSYLQSVNVDVKTSNLSTLLSDLGKDVYNYIIHPTGILVDAGSRYVYDVLSSKSKYFLSSLFKQVDDNVITESNYTDYKYQWKAHVSTPMSDIFNTVSRYTSWSVDPDSFVSIDNTIFSDYLNQSLYVNDTSYRIDDVVNFLKTNTPSVIDGSNSLSFRNTFTSTYTSSEYFPFDSILFFDNLDLSIYPSSTNCYFVDSEGNSIGSFQPGNTAPFVLFNSVNPYFHGIRRSDPTTCKFNLSGFSDFSSYVSIKQSGTAFTINDRSWEIKQFEVWFNNSGSYDFSSTYRFFLGLSSTLPSYLSTTNYNSIPRFANINAYHVSIPSNNVISIDDFEPIQIAPVVVDPSDAYQGSLQIPIDNAPGQVASIDLQSVIDAINDNSLSNNIDRLSDIVIDGVVGAIPTLSIDAWNPDNVTDLATSSDIALGLDSLSQIEDTVSTYVSPVFETFPIVPFLKPIIECLHSEVTSVIFVCIFIIVLFGFINKLLF